MFPGLVHENLSTEFLITGPHKPPKMYKNYSMSLHPQGLWLIGICRGSRFLSLVCELNAIHAVI